MWAGFIPFAINYIRLYVQINFYEKDDDFLYLKPEKLDLLWKLRNTKIATYIFS